MTGPELVTCPRCHREVHPWPLRRGAKCSPRDWVVCIRNDPPFDAIAVQSAATAAGRVTW